MLLFELRESVRESFSVASSDGPRPDVQCDRDDRVGEDFAPICRLGIIHRISESC